MLHGRVQLLAFVVPLHGRGPHVTTADAQLADNRTRRALVRHQTSQLALRQKLLAFDPPTQAPHQCPLHREALAARRKEHAPLQADTRRAAAGLQCLEWDLSKQRKCREDIVQWKKAPAESEANATFIIHSADLSNILPHMQQTKIVCTIN